MKFRYVVIALKNRGASISLGFATLAGASCGVQQLHRAGCWDMVYALEVP